MEFNNEFVVEKPIDEVWSTVLDLERVIPCVPGAAVVEKTGDDTVKAEVKIRLGSMSMNYVGPTEIVERDDDAHRAVLTGRARETRGQGSTDARIEIQLRESGEGTEVAIGSEINVSGKAAQMGEGVIAGVTEGMIGEFADNLAQL
jgi:uncharacterized protein